MIEQAIRQGPTVDFDSHLIVADRDGPHERCNNVRLIRRCPPQRKPRPDLVMVPLANRFELPIRFPK